MKKNILITGSTDGIGRLVAKKLAKDGHNLLIHGRNRDKLALLSSEIKEISKNVNVFEFAADFSDLGSVKQMVQKLNKEVEHIDVLINNAGVFKSPELLNKDGLDLRLTVNYLAPYVLTYGLIPLLNKGTEARIINLSSAAQSTVSLAILTGKEKLDISESYAQSKLALTMWSFKLAEELGNIAVIAVNPGSLLNTKMANEAYGQHWSPADKGADILYELALSAEHKGVTGQYFDNDKGSYGKAHRDAYDKNAIVKLIEATDNLIG